MVLRAFTASHCNGATGVDSILTSQKGSVANFERRARKPVCPENLKLFINLTFFEFLLMLDQ